MPTCVFCAIAAGTAPARIVYEDARTLAFLPRRPATVGHTLLVPRVHVRDLWDLPAPEAHHLTTALLTLAPAVRRAFSPDGLNVVNSAGAAATQTVFHLHVHLVPRWHGDTFGPLWPPPSDRPVPPDDVADRIRTEVARADFRGADGG
ncbi:HIT domain-containing protein [Streptomyces roseirectus]|uniref:HIT domain-containing protein n=1 Tax=Streptomyces roseirectus TaxID=2768066 RepID=A0A7H0IJP1_9ACTN|nr:HIT domain-containing protein [Streptomyces roseirectus]QNP73007.1 HIT domain-containing protein [Streptomyces roseirectus]